MPYKLSGYTVRSHALVSALAERGVRLSVVMRPDHPPDPDAEPKALTEYAGVPVHGNWRHRLALRQLEKLARCRFAPLGRARLRLHQDIFTAYYARYVARVARRTGADLLHAASDFANGLGAAAAGRALGVPVIYEVRGEWEETDVVRGVLAESSAEYRYRKEAEARAAGVADAVVAIGRALGADLVARGVAAAKITVVANAVDAEHFRPGPRDRELEAALALEDRFVVGYAGTLSAYEGLDLAVEAVARVRAEGVEASLLVVGDGPARRALEARARKAGLGAAASFVGRVAPDEVGRYISLFDVCVCPRLRSRLTELVPPIKPLEAMACARPVVASDVGGLAEIIEDGRTGELIPAGDGRALAGALVRLAREPERRRKLGRSARRWVETERTWRRAAGIYEGLYRELIARGRSERVSPYWVLPI
jgi:glycosyltransferase involved in cell wall biosynthesis